MDAHHQQDTHGAFQNRNVFKIRIYKIVQYVHRNKDGVMNLKDVMHQLADIVKIKPGIDED